MKNFIVNQIGESITTKKLVLDKCVKKIQDASLLMIDTIKSKNKILWCGNGGSAADAQHLSTELMGGMGNFDRKPIPSIALTTDSSFLTAWSNDNDFSSIFSRQIQGLGSPNDLLVAITTSGNSENIINAIKQAKYKNLKTIVLTGLDGGKINNLADITINVPSKNTQRIQESHIMIGQILCELLEKNIV
tara:strand:- start:593 stop:1162 length:570 start_codon:yes stop_codon:yes gene_type:complete